MKEVVLEMKDIHKSFGSVKVLKGVDLTLRRVRSTPFSTFTEPKDLWISFISSTTSFILPPSSHHHDPAASKHQL